MCGFLHWCRYKDRGLTFCLAFALWMYLEITGSLLGEELSCCCDCFWLKSVEELCHPPWDSNPCLAHLTAQYLDVHHRKLGTIIIQTIHILQHDSATTVSCSWRTFSSTIQITSNQPGSSTVTPPYQWRRLLVSFS